MKKELVHPVFPVTEVIIRETMVNNGLIEEVEKKVSMPSSLLNESMDETEDEKIKKNSQ